jgi:hypothetical protein
VAKRRREVKTYKYECNLTGEKYTLTKKAENADDLMSVTAYYDMQPDKDDRPIDIKKRLGLLEKKEDSPAVEETEEVSE